MRKFISVLLAVAMLFTYTAFAYAENSILPRSSNYFTGYGISLSNSGGAMIKILFSAEGTQICDEIGVVSFYVEKYNEDIYDWVSVTDLTAGQTGKDVQSYTYSKYFQGVAGEKYRVQATFMANINGTTEHKTFTSEVLTATLARG